MATDADIKFLVSNRDPTPLELDAGVTTYMISSPDILVPGTESTRKVRTNPNTRMLSIRRARRVVPKAYGSNTTH